MPDFRDIPDVELLKDSASRTPDLTRWVRLHGEPPTRREVKRRRRAALALSAGWLAVQFVAFGARGDLPQLPLAYVLTLIIGPISAGLLALVLAVRRGAQGLGTRAALVGACAVLGPLGFMIAGLAMHAPYERGEQGSLMFGAYCLNCTVVWALLPLVAAGLSLRGAFAASAGLRSALLGAGCGLVAAGLFTLHCPVVGRLHIALAHGGAALLAALIGALFFTGSTRS